MVLVFVFQGDLVLVLSIIAIANIIPVYASGVRRLHDTNKSGWFILISIIPITPISIWKHGVQIFCISNYKTNKFIIFF